MSFIETSNLDGETNLKIRQALPDTTRLASSGVENFTATLHCEQPNRHLYEFRGALKEPNVRYFVDKYRSIVKSIAI